MNVQGLLGGVRFFAKQHAPELLMAAGIGGMVGTVVLACKATLKVEGILEWRAEKKDDIETLHNEMVESDFPSTDYTEDDYKKDLQVVQVQTVVRFAKEYWPAVTLGIASIGCILGAHKMMAKRNVALMAAYKLVEESFNQYRQRVRDELGEEKDVHFRYGTHEVVETNTVVGEDGKKKKVTSVRQELDGMNVSGYARLFEKDVQNGDGTWTGSACFSPVHSYNCLFLTKKMDWCNDRLKSQGYLFLNDVYDELGFVKTMEGQELGWLSNGKGIDFGPCLENIYFAYHDGDPIVLDFNVDGPILTRAFRTKK